MIEGAGAASGAASGAGSMPLTHFIRIQEVQKHTDPTDPDPDSDPDPQHFLLSIRKDVLISNYSNMPILSANRMARILPLTNQTGGCL